MSSAQTAKSAIIFQMGAPEEGAAAFPTARRLPGDLSLPAKAVAVVPPARAGAYVLADTHNAGEVLARRATQAVGTAGRPSSPGLDTGCTVMPASTSLVGGEILRAHAEVAGRKGQDPRCSLPYSKAIGPPPSSEVDEPHRAAWPPGLEARSGSDAQAARRRARRRRRRGARGPGGDPRVTV